MKENQKNSHIFINLTAVWVKAITCWVRNEKMASRYSTEDVLAMIANDSDSGSELEIDDNVSALFWWKYFQIIYNFNSFFLI